VPSEAKTSEGIMPKTASDSEKLTERNSVHQSYQNTPLTLDQTIPTSSLNRWIDEWLMECELRLQSRQTIKTRRSFLKHFLWLLNHRGYNECGTAEIKQFLHYLQHGHEEEGGRWGQGIKTPVRPVTIKDYHRCINSFFKWLEAEEIVSRNLCGKIPVPRVRREKIEPFTQEQVTALLQAAKRSSNARRDEAIVLFLLDTGVRASELCGIKMRDIDLHSKSVRVTGKGNKQRVVFYGHVVGLALGKYLRHKDRTPDTPLFTAERGRYVGQALTPSGLLQIMRRLCADAKIQATKKGPHQLRRTFSVEFLRNGGNVFTLKEILAHSEISTTEVYVSIAQADIETAQRKFSPADRLGARGK
jgi:site-specific recombinase XerD